MNPWPVASIDYRFINTHDVAFCHERASLLHDAHQKEREQFLLLLPLPAEKTARRNVHGLCVLQGSRQCRR